jgi:hypothetical protein
MQLLAAYANGMNPEVPPYVALGEIQRRNKLDQEKQVEPPTGTVKEQLEQQAGLAALQQMRMGQAQQQMMQGAAQQPMPVPEGAPQPEMQPEMSGIANAAAQPGGMQPGVMGMAGGGIVAFAKAGDVDEDEDEDDEDEDEDEEEAGAGYGGVDTGEFPAETYAVPDRPALNARDLEGLAALGVTPFAHPSQAQAPQDPYDNRATRTPPTGIVNHGPIQPPQAPQGLQSIAQQLADRQAQAAQQRAAMPQAPQMPTRESMARENPAMYGVLNKPVGQDYLTGLQALLAKQAAEDPKAMEQLERNKRMAFFKALIDAGEATRGQRGFGPLAAGFGRSMIPALKGLAEEETGIRGLALKRDELLNKAKFDVEKLQRAQGEGDLKAEQKSKQDLFKSAVELYRSGNASLAREIGALAGIREAEIRAAATEQAAKIRAAAKGQGAKPDKITDQSSGIEVEYQALLAQNYPPGPATRQIAQRNYLLSRGIPALEGAITRGSANTEAILRQRELLNTDLWGKSDAEKEAWRKAERAKIVAEDEARKARAKGIPDASAPTTAPRGTKENPIKLPD